MSVFSSGVTLQASCGRVGGAHDLSRLVGVLSRSSPWRSRLCFVVPCQHLLAVCALSLQGWGLRVHGSRSVISNLAVPHHASRRVDGLTAMPPTGISTHPKPIEPRNAHPATVCGARILAIGFWCKLLCFLHGPVFVHFCDFSTVLINLTSTYYGRDWSTGLLYQLHLKPLNLETGV